MCSSRIQGSVNHCAERARALRATATDGSLPASQDGTEIECAERFSLVVPHVCQSAPAGSAAKVSKKESGDTERRRNDGSHKYAAAPPHFIGVGPFRPLRGGLRRASLVRESREGEELLSEIGKSRAAC